MIGIVVVLIGVFGVLVRVLGVLVGEFGLKKLCSKYSLARSLWKKVHQLEKSTPTLWVA